MNTNCHRIQIPSPILWMVLLFLSSLFFLSYNDILQIFSKSAFYFSCHQGWGWSSKINDWNSAIQVDCQHGKKQIETGKELSENLCSVGCFSLRNICSWILHFQPGLHWVIRAWHHRLFWIGRVTPEKKNFTKNKGLSLFFTLFFFLLLLFFF